MTIPAVPKGYERTWVRCKRCRRVAFYDYIPYSLSNTIMSMPCGHDVGQSFHAATESISADEALISIANARQASESPSHKGPGT